MLGDFGLHRLELRLERGDAHLACGRLRPHSGRLLGEDVGARMSHLAPRLIDGAREHGDAVLRLGHELLELGEASARWSLATIQLCRGAAGEVALALLRERRAELVARDACRLETRCYLCLSRLSSGEMFGGRDRGHDRFSFWTTAMDFSTRAPRLAGSVTRSRDRTARASTYVIADVPSSPITGS